MQQEMLQRGAGGYLSRAYEVWIPIAKIDGLEPTPAAADEEGYWKGRPILQPIEVSYDRSNDLYMLYAGNHRVTQAKLNGDAFIRAFVQPDGGDIGRSALDTPPASSSPPKKARRAGGKALSRRANPARHPRKRPKVR